MRARARVCVRECACVSVRACVCVPACVCVCVCQFMWSQSGVHRVPAFIIPTAAQRPESFRWKKPWRKKPYKLTTHASRSCEFMPNVSSTTYSTYLSNH